jgi:DNA-binding beta-propeller fold protein YncE
VVGAAALDPATHTAYLGDEAGDRVLVVDTDACHAGRVTGCAPVASVGVGAAGPNAIAVDPGTHTVYTAQGGDSTVAVFSGMRCNAVSPAGCPGQARVVPVGAPPTEVAVDPATGSVYVSEYQADQAELLDGAAGVVATLPTGRNPAGLAVDRGTHTLYVANQAFDEEPGSLSIVDTHRCNAADTSGCGGPFPTAASGRGPFALALDSGTHTVYATDIGDASISMIDGAGCNATVTTSCGRAPARVPVGDAPFGLALDAPAHTVYALDGDGQVSMIFSRPPRRGAGTP